MPPIPQQFGRYRIDKLLGEGGMGAVHLATDGSLGRRIALKIPHVGGPDAAQTVERFLREARLAATLDHPNICPVYDVGEVDGTPYLTMRYVEGRPLSRYINPGRLQNPRSVALIVRKLADALEHAHQHGVIHRDLKPANILIDAKNEPIVMDFGLARQIGGTNEKQVTQSGMIVGTPAYMSPEQVTLESDQVDARTDIWSLGVVFFEMLTGRLPYDGTVLQIIGALQHLDPPRAQDVAPAAPERLSSICRRMMTRDRDQRHQTMSAVADEVSAWIRDPAAGTQEAGGEPVLASVALPRSVITSDHSQTAVAPRSSSTATQAGAAPVDVFTALLQAPPPRHATAPKRIPRHVVWLSAGGVLTLGLLVSVFVFSGLGGPRGNASVAPAREANPKPSSADAVEIIDGESNATLKPAGESAEQADETLSAQAKSEGADSSRSPADIASGNSAPDAKSESAEIARSSGPGEEPDDTAIASPKGRVGLQNGDFSDGFNGWTLDKGSTGFRVFQSRPGEKAMTTYGVGTGDRDEGRMHQTFIVPDDADALEFFVHGSARAECHVALKQGDQTVHKVNGPNQQAPVRVEWALKALRGKTVLLEIVDRTQGNYGYVGAHGFRILGGSSAVDAPAGPVVADNLKTGVERLKRALIGYRWNYVDSKHPPGGPVRFHANGKFHDQWKWNYWVVGPKTMHVQFWDPNYHPNKSVVFTFNDDLTQFSAQFDGHRVTGRRLEQVKKPEF